MTEPRTLAEQAWDKPGYPSGWADVTEIVAKVLAQSWIKITDDPKSAERLLNLAKAVVLSDPVCEMVGGEGWECRICGATAEYQGAIAHEQFCAFVMAEKELELPPPPESGQ